MNKYKIILFFIIIIIIITSCGPTGATRNERIIAEQNVKAGDEILKKQNPSLSDLNNAYKLLNRLAKAIMMMKENLLM